MSASKTTADAPAEKPDYDGEPIGHLFVEGFGADLSHRLLNSNRISPQVPTRNYDKRTPEGDIELEPEYRVRFSHLCSNDLLGGFPDYDGSQVIVVNGNNIRKDSDGSLLSVLCGHMIRTFQKYVRLRGTELELQ
jgi:hypothetical protein